MASVLVLGIGNPPLADDGAGVHAALRLLERAAGRDEVMILDAGTLSFSLPPALRNADGLIAIDATRDGGCPGVLKVCEGEAFARFVRRSGRSVNEVGLADLLELAVRRPVAREPGADRSRARDGGLGPGTQSPVAAALARCVDLALEFIERWHPSREDRAH